MSSVAIRRAATLAAAVQSRVRGRAVPSTPPLPAIRARDGGDEGNSPSPPFPIVGIGASAGGLEALTCCTRERHGRLDGVRRRAAPRDRPRELAAKGGSGPLEPIPVHAITRLRWSGTTSTSAPARAERGGPARRLAPHAGVVSAHRRLLPFAGRGHGAPGHRRRAVGDRDATARGELQIKSRGGLAFCQDPPSAKFDSMPRNPSTAGSSIARCRPRGSAPSSMSLGEHPYLARKPRGAPRPLERDHLAKLFSCCARRSVHFHALQAHDNPRRVERAGWPCSAPVGRVVAGQPRGAGGPSSRRPHRRHQLLPRRAEPVRWLERLIPRRILERKRPAQPFAVWVPACASGEEASRWHLPARGINPGAHNYRIGTARRTWTRTASAPAPAQRTPGASTMSRPEAPAAVLRQVGHRELRMTLARALRLLAVNVVSDAPFSRMRPRELPEPAHLFAVAAPEESAAAHPLRARRRRLPESSAAPRPVARGAVLGRPEKMYLKEPPPCPWQSATCRARDGGRHPSGTTTRAAEASAGPRRTLADAKLIGVWAAQRAGQREPGNPAGIFG